MHKVSLTTVCALALAWSALIVVSLQSLERTGFLEKDEGLSGQKHETCASLFKQSHKAQGCPVKAFLLMAKLVTFDYCTSENAQSWEDRFSSGFYAPVSH